MELLIKIKIEIIYQLRFALRCFTATVVKYFTCFPLKVIEGCGKISNVFSLAKGVYLCAGSGDVRILP